jgi:putative heme-binding domain-containing protein
MYRLVLEHPEWIPKQMQAHLDLRAGEDKGRIYRIRPEGAPSKPRSIALKVPDDKMTVDLLLANQVLEENGWRSDTAQRMILQHDGQEALLTTARYLSGIFSRMSAQDPAITTGAYVRALWTLHLMDELTPLVLMQAMASTQPLIREHAVRLAEHHLGDKTVLDAVCNLAGDSDIRVRVQVALTLGESSDSRIPPILRGLFHGDAKNKDMLAALLSSVSKHASALASDIPHWQAALKTDDKRIGAPAPVIITNASPDREKVVKQYASASQLTGNPTTGHALYTNVCSACHRLKNEGTEIGPDLGMVAAKPVEQIIEAILDPNRAVEARYTTQTLATKQGRDVIGLVIEETPNSLTVRTAIGLETILRADIAKRSGNTKSLMPEGLETLLTPQHVADILAWIRQK